MMAAIPSPTVIENLTVSPALHCLLVTHHQAGLSRHGPNSRTRKSWCSKADHAYRQINLNPSLIPRVEAINPGALSIAHDCVNL